MLDITHKIFTYRLASAQAVVRVSRKETMEAVKAKTVPKGDVFECARVAGLLAIKKTSDSIPDCHPMPIESASVFCEMGENEIIINVEVATIYKTGVEVEAMHGAAVAALTIYDMLKPLDEQIEITSIKLQDKKGGKSSYTHKSENINVAVIVCSDSVAGGTKEDKAGKVIVDKMESMGAKISCYEIIPDEAVIIREKALALAEQGVDLVLFTGGTGLSPRDVTPEAIAPLLEKTVPGIMEAARNYGQMRTPYAMLSRGIAGYIRNTLVLTLPGSTRGAEETIDVLFPYIFHLFKVRKGYRHDQ